VKRSDVSKTRPGPVKQDTLSSLLRALVYLEITLDCSVFEAQATADVIGPGNADKICADTYLRQWREKPKRLELYHRLVTQQEAPLDPVLYS
jgi:hypothetical protein